MPSPDETPMTLLTFSLPISLLPTKKTTNTKPKPTKTVQTNPTKYRSIGTGFSTIVREQGLPGLFRGWLPTLLGYSAQGAFKFGLYEYFKK